MPTAFALCSYHASVSSMKKRVSAVNAPAFDASKNRSSNGTLSTHWRMGTFGRTRSVRCAAALHIRRALQLGHRPLILHENATTICR
jgi:hypothetical protein